MALTEKYNMNKELNNLVNLRYDQVVNSLRKLCTEESKNYMRDVSLNLSKMQNLNQSTNYINEEKQGIKEEEKENEENRNEMIIEQRKEKENEKEENEENDETNQQKTQQQQNEDIKDLKENVEPQAENEEKLQTNNEPESRNKQNNAEVENIPKSNNENNIISNDEFNTNNNLANINNSSTVNINMSGFGNVSLLEQDEEAKLIKSYKEYLAQAEKTIDALFLMKTKNDFLQMVRDKASEFDEANKTLKIIKKVQDSNKNRGSISRGLSRKSDQNSELEYAADDASTKEKELQDKIFRTYMNAERKKMEKFINNEKDVKLIKK